MMETKNAILVNYAQALTNTVGNILAYAGSMGDNLEENLSYIKTLDVQMESLRGQTVLLQQALDNYPN